MIKFLIILFIISESVWYTVWYTHLINDGKNLAGAIACMSFGCALYCLVKILDNIYDNGLKSLIDVACLLFGSFSIYIFLKAQIMALKTASGFIKVERFTILFDNPHITGLIYTSYIVALVIIMTISINVYAEKIK